jgi:uncharacterized repeat protein (TIGR03803 family)
MQECIRGKQIRLQEPNMKKDFGMKKFPRKEMISLSIQFATLFLTASAVFAAEPQTLYLFTGPPDAFLPNAGLARDANGDFYGTTFYGGAFNMGAVYKITPKGKETLLHSFAGGSDGAYPAAALIAGQGGTLYGTTEYGGTGACTDSQGVGCGTVFQITEAGVEAVVYSFQGGNDGWVPNAGVIQVSNGDLYGTTNSGGPYNSGILFHLTLSGAESVLYTFNSNIGGFAPGGLVEGNDGNFYATLGGGDGSVFKITPTGTFTSLYVFGTNPNDAAFPIGTLTKAADGVFLGAVFSITPAGVETLVYSFTGGADGSMPRSTPLLTAGIIYGATPLGGSNGFGTIFALTKKGVETTLYTFTECENAGGIQGVGLGLAQGNDDYAYGVNVGACSNGDPYGSVYRIKE